MNRNVLEHWSQAPPAPAHRPCRHASQFRHGLPQRARERLPACRAGGRGRDAIERPLPPRDAVGYELSEREARRKVSKAVMLVRRGADLVPHEPQAFNYALAVWKAVREIPPEKRVELLGRLSSQDMEQLWQVAGLRYAASAQDAQATLGPGYSVWDEFPTQPDKVATFEGKASLPLLSRFRKRFFLHPRSLELYGFVDVGAGWLGRALFPLYFRCNVDGLLFPGTVGLTDMQLEYQPPAQLGLPAELLPRGAGLPAPGTPRWPFSGGLRDYMRPVGPGVFVGRGWKQPPGSGDAREGSPFLHFVLVRR